MTSLSIALCTAALLFEAAVGYPDALFTAVGHPVTWIGRVIDTLDRRTNDPRASHSARRASGFVALAVICALAIGSGFLVERLAFAALPPLVALAVVAVIASSLLAQRSLATHVAAVAEGLARDLQTGRAAVSMIVGRDTLDLDEAGVSRAAIESLAENFSDGIVAPAFWLALGGLPGVLLYKAVNTADSMIGHRTLRHEAFGFAAARCDDVLNLVPARLSIVWIALAAFAVPGASARRAWRTALRDARGHPSPNAGWPEAAMAGALGIRLGGPRSYQGRIVEDAVMGEGGAPVTRDTIRRALLLYRYACAIQIVALAVAGLAVAALRLTAPGR